MRKVGVAAGLQATHDGAMTVHIFLIGKSHFNLLYPNSKTPSDNYTSGQWNRVKASSEWSKKLKERKRFLNGWDSSYSASCSPSSRCRVLVQPAFGVAVRWTSSGLEARRSWFCHWPHCDLAADSDRVTTHSGLTAHHCEVGVLGNISSPSQL